MKRQQFAQTPRVQAVETVVSLVRQKLAKLGNNEIKITQECYFHNVIVFHGLKSPSLDTLYKEVTPHILELSTQQRLELARTLLRSPYAEEKGFSARILHTCRKGLGVEFLEQFEPEFRAYVFDWGTADTLSGKVFRHLIEQGDKTATRHIVSWRNDSSLWMQRMAAVSFVWLARHGNVTTEVLRVCRSTIKNPERFIQLGTGWVLRELWLAEPERVEAFISKNYRSFSREGLRYAIEKMPKELRKQFLER